MLRSKAPSIACSSRIDLVGGGGGVKIREGKHVPAARHAARAAALFRRMALLPSPPFEGALGITPAALAVEAEAATTFPTALREPAAGQLPQPVYYFILAPKSGRG